MYKLFVWMLLISGIIFSAINLVFIILNRAPKNKALRYIILGCGILMFCGIAGIVLTNLRG